MVVAVCCSKVKRKILFCVAAFVAAALIFFIQPMAGRMLLPAVGGAPSGWLVAMFFFQASLLFGYFLAHKLSRLSINSHGALFLFALALGVAFQPLHLPNKIDVLFDLPDSISVLLTLISFLAIPFIALSMSAPTLQRLFSSSSSSTEEDSYFMFAASNLGGFFGLLSGPLVADRFLGLKAQTLGWSAAYIALILIAFLCLVVADRKHEAESQGVTKRAIPMSDKVQWVLWSFIPVSLMMSVTDLVSSDTGSAPLFWILPLALYLISFIVAFARRNKPELLRKVIRSRTMLMAVVAFMFLQNPAEPHGGIEYAVVALLAFGVISLQFQLMLADSRPSQENATTYYQSMALGGLLGGAFNAFIVPLIFPLPLEFVVVGLISCWMIPHWERSVRSSFDLRFFVYVAIALMAGSILVYARSQGIEGKTYAALAWVVLLISMLKISANIRALTFVACSIAIISLTIPGAMRLIDVDRNFFGTVRVYEIKKDKDKYLALYNGSSMHSIEQKEPKFSVLPKVLFGPEGAIENVFTLKEFPNVAIVGLGAGTMLCYQDDAGFHHDFVAYEINPAVVEAAEEKFDYIKKCARPEIRIGDARRLLAEDKNKKYDLIVFNVFSSASIPTHLITKEAFQLYLERLNPEGVMLWHVYSWAYDLRSVISASADELGLHMLYKFPNIGHKEVIGDSLTIESSPWVVISRKGETIESLKEKGWEQFAPKKIRPWTDDYFDIVSAIK